jgi:hypothetical protein
MTSSEKHLFHQIHPLRLPADRSRLVAVWLVLVSTVSCTSKPLRVGVVFENGWKLGDETLTEREQSLVKSTAVQILRSAYNGFNVQFRDGPSGDRLIKVEDTPYASYAPGAIAYPIPAVGTTFPMALISSVRLDALYSVELAVAQCRDITGCETKTREELLRGLGRGVGATAAHELGHQGGLNFSRDSRCDDCYDGHTANAYVHFFGAKHWSNTALMIMRRALPSVGISSTP